MPASTRLPLAKPSTSNNTAAATPGACQVASASATAPASAVMPARLSNLTPSRASRYPTAAVSTVPSNNDGSQCGNNARADLRMCTSAANCVACASTAPCRIKAAKVSP